LIADRLFRERFKIIQAERLVALLGRRFRGGPEVSEALEQRVRYGEVVDLHRPVRGLGARLRQRVESFEQRLRDGVVVIGRFGAAFLEGGGQLEAVGRRLLGRAAPFQRHVVEEGREVLAFPGRVEGGSRAFHAYVEQVGDPVGEALRRGLHVLPRLAPASEYLGFFTEVLYRGLELLDIL